jgi:hypothetical protein
MENFILSQPKELQQKIKDREKQMYDRVGKRFESIEQIQKFLSSQS